MPRTHRERKEFYIKNIEAEVVKLREKDFAHEQVVIGLKRKISELNKILVANGIPVPPNLFNIESPQATITLRMQDGVQNVKATLPKVNTAQNQTRMHVDMVPSSSATATNSEMLDLMGTPEKMRLTPARQLPPTLQAERSPPKGQTIAHPHGLDDAQVAIDFVLDLERPCLTHHGPEIHNGDFNGHTLMVQTPIMASSSTPRPVYNLKHGGTLPYGTTWTVPAVEVERLLNLSSRLSLEGELTPIEAWQRIKQHPCFATLDRERLQQLKTVLVPEVHCWG